MENNKHLYNLSLHKGNVWTSWHVQVCQITEVLLNRNFHQLIFAAVYINMLQTALYVVCIIWGLKQYIQITVTSKA